jgi:hypothetical protein
VAPVPDYVLVVASWVLFLYLGCLIGRRLPRRSRDAPLVCPCGHGLNFHEPFDRYGRRRPGIIAGPCNKRWGLDSQCSCQQYTGPELPSWVTNQIMEGEKE